MMKKIGLIAASVAAVAVIFVGARSFACDDSKQAKTSNTSTVEAKSCCPTSTSTSASMVNNKHCSSTGTANKAADGERVSAGDHCGSAKAALTGKSCGSKSAMASGKTCGSKSAMASTSNSCGSDARMTSGKSCGTQTAGSKDGCTPGSKGTRSSKASYAANVYRVENGQQYAVAQGKTFQVTGETPYYDLGTARYYFADTESVERCSEKMASFALEIDKETVSLATSEANTETDSHGKKYAVCPVNNSKFLVTSDTPVFVKDGQKYYSCSDHCQQAMLSPALHTDSHNAQ